LIFPFVSGGVDHPGQGAKKNDEVEHFEVFDLVGLLVNEPPGTAGSPFI
jgi:hypothetical protein